jgi:hypothetical protein
VQPTDGSQVPLTVYDGSEWGVDVLYVDGTTALNQPVARWLDMADFIAIAITNLTTCSAGAQLWLKSQLRAFGNQFTFDNDR